jgi:hypothetical protein
MAQDADGLVRCGEHILLNFEWKTLPADLHFVQPEPGKKKAATINLVAGPTLLANTNALNAWNAAVAEWEAILGDNVTVKINADLAALGPGILGSTSSSTWSGVGYTGMRNAMVADAAADETIATQLPTLAQFNIALPPGGFSFANDLSATKANLRALGFDMSFDDPNPDATITFSTNFPFDYTRGNGIDAGRYDFQGIAFHELGHALGFTSRVDYVDYLVNNSLTDAIYPTPLDMYRLLAGVGASNFTSGARQLVTGAIAPAQKSYNGIADLGMSTGTALGDGRQASHWKANELSGTYIGVMDPTASPGELLVTTADDIRMFGLIGWDVVNGGIVDCNNNMVDDALDILLGTSQDCNGNGIPDECDIADATSNDVNSNGIPDECETDCNNNNVPDDWDISQGTSQDCNNNSIPDECDIASATSNDVNTNGIPDECEPTAVEETPKLGYRANAVPNPFNPATTITFELAKPGRVKLVIYDVTGRKVRTLVDRDYQAGVHQVGWRGGSEGGATVASGVYYAVYSANGKSVRIKLTLLK